MYFLLFHLKEILFERLLRKRLVLYAILLSFGKPVIAQSPLFFQHLSTANGLSSNIVHRLFQDSRGFLWISTTDGLNMYDGETIQKYYLSDFLENTFTNYTDAIAEDSDHNILVAGKAGIVKFSWYDKKFTIVYKNSFSNYGNFFPEIFIDSHKNIWINERIRIKEFDPHFHLLHNWTIHTDADKYLNGPSNTFIIGEDHAHNIWVKDYDSVFLLHPQTTTVHDSILAKMQAITTAYKKISYLQICDSAIWLIADNYNLLQVDQNAHIKAIYKLPSTIFPSYKNVIVSKKHIWLGTNQDGVFMIDETSGKIEQVKSGDEKGSLSSNSITTLFLDKTHNLWVGTKAGINLLPFVETSFQQLRLHYAVDKFLKPVVIQNIFLQKKLLFVITSGGVLRADLSTSSSVNFFKSNTYIANAFPMKDHWLVANNNRLETWDIKDNTFTRKNMQVAFPAILNKEGVYSFYKDHQQAIWMGLFNDAGIICWHTKDNHIDWYSQQGKGKNYCPLRHFKYAMEDSKGNIWMGYEKGGIAIFDKQAGIFISPPAFGKIAINNMAVQGMVNDNRQHLWIATNNGLLCYHETTGTYQRLTRQNGLPSNNVLSLAKDNTGTIWAGFEGALASIQVSSGEITTYTSSDGLQNEEYLLASFDSVSESMFFCTDKSVTYFDPEHIKKFRPILTPVITSIQVMGKEQPYREGEKLALSYSNNFISFNFSAPNYFNAAENEYACKLVGADADWVFLGNRHLASYGPLLPGKYIFYIRARSRDGSWHESSFPVFINMLTPFWRRTWFLFLVAGFFLLLLFAFIYVRLKHKLDQQILAQTIRDKIARDLHDDVGSTLSSISIYSELAKQKSPESLSLLENISRNASQMLENMSDIVWTINPKNDRFANVIQRMSQFAADMLETKNMTVEFSSEEDLFNLSMPMEKRKNVYLIFKEAIHNCSKYSEATNVQISLSKRNQQIYLQIKDNGKGFDTTKTFPGNGMNTMQSRVQALQGRFEIKSAHGQGTTVFVSFPCS